MPFGKENLDRIFKVSPNSSDRLVSRENGWLEFKETFHWKSREDYAKTMASFANNQGGYIVFGVTNHPRVLVGLKTDDFAKSLDDPKDMTATLNSAFSPEINWETHIHKIGDKVFGLIYVGKATTKPVVCLKTCGKLTEGAIYYRYRGRSELIKYPELRDILDAERARERQLWMKHLGKMSKVGIGNVGVLDLQTGEVSGSSGKFLISEELLPRLKFINEGHFVEKDGEPAIMVVGQVQVVGKGLLKGYRTKVEPRNIHAPDIIRCFLEQVKVDHPEMYVTQMCYEPSSYLPVFYYIRQAGWTVKTAIEALRKVECSAKGTKTKLIERIFKPVRMKKQGTLTAETPQSIKRAKWVDHLRKGDFKTFISPDDYKYVFEAVTHLEKGEFTPAYVLGVLRDIVFLDYNMFAGIAGSRMRQAVSHLDMILSPMATMVRVDAQAR
jgi:hypothetical protein